MITVNVVKIKHIQASVLYWKTFWVYAQFCYKAHSTRANRFRRFKDVRNQMHWPYLFRATLYLGEVTRVW